MNKGLHIIFLDMDDVKNPLLNAGQARATYEVGRRLVKLGHKVTVICSRYPGYKDREDVGIEYKHIGFDSSNVKLNNVLYILLLPFTVRKLKADVIIECFTAPISTLFSPLFTKVPVVGLPTSFDAERFSKLYHLPFHFVERFGAKFYKYFLPYTEFYKQKMERLNPNIAARIVPEGVGEEFFNIEQKEPKHILFLGRYDIDQKGIDLLLESYSKVRDRISYPLVIAGLGPDEEKIKEKVHELKLEDVVTVTGPAYGDAKAKLLAESLYVAFPSRQEGFSLFSLEALASGLPLVSFDIPALSWAGPGVALKAPCFDTDAYSKKLLEATKPEVIAPMREAARELARNYTWDDVARGFERFFCEVVLCEGSSHPTVSVAIPAHNEQANIANLLESIADQKGNFRLERIFVTLDGCTDDTELIVKDFQMRYPGLVQLVNDGKRLGKAARMNEMYKKNESDFLATFDADVILGTSYEIERMINVMRMHDDARVVAGHIVLEPGENIVSKVLAANHNLWVWAVSRFRGGRNIHASHGAAFLLKKEFLETFSFPQGITCDQGFIYCAARPSGFYSAYDTTILSNAPTSLAEMRVGYGRTIGERQDLVDSFGPEVLKEFDLPLSIKVRGVVHAFIRHPFLTSLAVAFNLWIRRAKILDLNRHDGLWTIIRSSKRPVVHK